jgi:hypothetical protein
MMQKDIIEIENEQRLFSIIIAEVTSESIEAAFNKRLKELTIIADLFTFRKKVGVNKTCFWWGPRVKEANATAKRSCRRYLAAPSTIAGWSIRNLLF